MSVAIEEREILRMLDELGMNPISVDNFRVSFGERRRQGSGRGVEQARRVAAKDIHATFRRDESIPICWNGEVVPRPSRRRATI